MTAFKFSVDSDVARVELRVMHDYSCHTVVAQHTMMIILSRIMCKIRVPDNINSIRQLSHSTPLTIGQQRWANG